MGDYALRGFDEVHDDRKINGKGGEEYWEEAIENTLTTNLFLCGLPL